MEYGIDTYQPKEQPSIDASPESSDKTELSLHEKDMFVNLLHDALLSPADDVESQEKVIELVRDHVAAQGGLKTRIGEPIFLSILEGHLKKHTPAPEIEAFITAHLSQEAPFIEDPEPTDDRPQPLEVEDDSKHIETAKGLGAEEIARQRGVDEAIADDTWKRWVGVEARRYATLHNALDLFARDQLGVADTFTAIYDTRIQDLVGADPRVRRIAYKIMLPLLLTYKEAEPITGNGSVRSSAEAEFPDVRSMRRMGLEEELASFIDTYTASPELVAAEHFHRGVLDLKDMQDIAAALRPVQKDHEKATVHVDPLTATDEMAAWKENLSSQLEANMLLRQLKTGKATTGRVLAFFEDAISQGERNPTLHEYLRRLFAPLLLQFERGEIDAHTLMDDLVFYRSLVQDHREPAAAVEVEKPAIPPVTNEYVIRSLASGEMKVPQAIDFVKARLRHRAIASKKTSDSDIDRTVDRVTGVLIQPILDDLSAGRITQEIATKELEHYEQMFGTDEEIAQAA